MVVFDVPVRRTTVKIGGASEDVLIIDAGFWEARREGMADDAVAGPTLGLGGIKVSNPLIEAFLSWSDIGPGEQVGIRLVELPYSNPGTDDNGPSLVHNDVRPV